MIDYSGLVVLFLLFPLFMQIIVPLLVLIGFGVVSVVRTVFEGQKVVKAARGGTDILIDLQPSRR